MTKKGNDLQKMVIGGAVIAGAATYAATHKKQTKKVLSEIAKKTEEAVKHIDTEKVKELGDVALSRLQKTKTAKKVEKKLPSEAKKAVKKIAAEAKSTKPTAKKTTRRKS